MKHVMTIIFMSAVAGLMLAGQLAAQEKVTLQLKFKHQFQFAGYYAAVEKGFYAENGMEVKLIEGKPGGNEIDELISGAANYAVGMADALIARFKGQPIVVLANIFQHSPVIFLTLQESNITSPQDLFGKSIMMTPGRKSAELQAILLNEGVALDKIKLVTPSWNINDLISGKVEAIAAYISSQPFILNSKNIPFNIITPKTYGIDFYGDNLITTEQEVKEHPKRVKAFKNASLKGWKYALEHSDEIIDLILSEYNTQTPKLKRELLFHEAETYHKLILPDFVKIGHINPGRWKHIAQTYANLGMIDKQYSLEGFIYNPEIKAFDWGHWAIKLILFVLSGVTCIAVIMLMVNRRISKEIVERRHAENALRESEQRYRSIMEKAADAIFLHDKAGRILDVNQIACQSLGYSRKELLSMSITDIDPKAIKNGMHENWEDIFLQNHATFESTHKRKDGSFFPVEVTLSSMDLPSGQAIIGIVRDITERQHLELKVKQAQKMESVGTLAGGIAHDFNNILSSIIGFTELALKGVEKGTETEDDLHEVLNGGMRAKGLVNQILAFARQSDEQVKPIQVNAIAREVIKFIKSTIPATIRINEKIDSHSFIIGSPTQVHQIVMNLCANASQAMEENGGILEISIHDIKTDTTNPIKNLRHGDYIKMTIKDTGVGIPSQYIDTIFDPYFTTKEKGEGTGMGLAVVHGIVESYDGKITVDSTLNKGTVFSVYLPITKKRTIHPYSEVRPLPSGKERILFVDDELPISKMGSRILETLGYTVTIRTSSIEALELFRSKPQEFDLVITDMTMPNMTGDLLTIELMKIRTDIPVILCTGYSKKISEETAKEIGIRAFAYKPVVKADLAVIIRNVLDDAQQFING